MYDNRTLYEINVQDRSRLRYIAGLIVRWKQNIKYVRARRIARKRGATIGEGVIMPMSLAKRANSNLVIGDHTSIQTINYIFPLIPTVGKGVLLLTLSWVLDEKRLIFYIVHKSLSITQMKGQLKDFNRYLN